MSYGRAKALYTGDATQTASPARLLTMLYDRLVVDVTMAHEAMLRGDVAVTGERISHACDILLELRSTLDTQVWPEGEGLAALYLWAVGELMQARLKGHAQRVADVRDLIVPLRDAWRAAGGQLAASDGAVGVA